VLKRLALGLFPQGFSEGDQPLSLFRRSISSQVKQLSGFLIDVMPLLPLMAFAWLLAYELFGDHGSGCGRRPFQCLRALGRSEVLHEGPCLVMQELQVWFPGSAFRQWRQPGMIVRDRIAGPPPEEHDAVAWVPRRGFHYLRNHFILLDLHWLPISMATLGIQAALR